MTRFSDFLDPVHFRSTAFKKGHILDEKSLIFTDFDEKYHVFDPKNTIWGMVYSELTIIFGPRSPVYKEGTPLEPRVLGHDSPHFIGF